MESRAEQLGVLLPDLVTRMETTRVDILEPLLADLPSLTKQLIGLRECLPGINISRYAGEWSGPGADRTCPFICAMVTRALLHSFQFSVSVSAILLRCEDRSQNWECKAPVQSERVGSLAPYDWCC